MNTVFTLRALLFAGEVYAGAALIIVAAWLVATQKRASARHLTWFAAFAATVLLPALLLVTPSTFRILLAAPSQVAAVPRLIGAPDVAMAATTLPAPAPPTFSFDTPTIALALFTLWLAGVGTVLGRSLVSSLCLALLKRRSRPFAAAPEGLPSVHARHQECELRLSHTEAGPMTWGVVHPVILLPKSAVSWPRERLQAVLLHELAHIRRRDALTQAVSQIACAFYWPNPLVWLAAHRLRREAEMAADDCVLISGVVPSSYASELLQMAGEFRARMPALAAAPLSMAAPSSLEARIKSVLASTSTRSGVTSMDVLKVLGAGLLATTAIAFACPSLAQEAPPPVAPAPVVVTSDVPPAPAVPAIPEAPPAPPAPPKVGVSPAEAADVADPARTSEHFIINTNHKLTPAEREQIRIEIRKASNEAREAIAKAKPAIEKAMVEAKIGHEEAARAMRDLKPQIEAAMVEVKKARPEIEKAIAEVHVSDKAIQDAQPQIKAAMDEVERTRPEIDAALAKAQPEIDAALAKVREELAKDHLDADIQVRVNSALKRAEIQIDAAQARANAREGKRIETTVVTTDDQTPPEKN